MLGSLPWLPAPPNWSWVPSISSRAASIVSPRRSGTVTPLIGGFGCTGLGLAIQSWTADPGGTLVPGGGDWRTTVPAASLPRCPGAPVPRSGDPPCPGVLWPRPPAARPDRAPARSAPALAWRSRAGRRIRGHPGPRRRRLANDGVRRRPRGVLGLQCPDPEIHPAQACSGLGLRQPGEIGHQHVLHRPWPGDPELDGGSRGHPGPRRRRLAHDGVRRRPGGVLGLQCPDPEIHPAQACSGLGLRQPGEIGHQHVLHRPWPGDPELDGGSGGHPGPRRRRLAYDGVLWLCRGFQGTHTRYAKFHGAQPQDGQRQGQALQVRHDHSTARPGLWLFRGQPVRHWNTLLGPRRRHRQEEGDRQRQCEDEGETAQRPPSQGMRKISPSSNRSPIPGTPLGRSAAVQPPSWNPLLPWSAAVGRHSRGADQDSRNRSNPPWPRRRRWDSVPQPCVRWTPPPPRP